MTFCKENYNNQEGWIAYIGYHKSDKNPHLNICEKVSDIYFVTRFCSYYDSEAKARKALYAFAKRNGLNKFKRV